MVASIGTQVTIALTQLGRNCFIKIISSEHHVPIYGIQSQTQELGLCYSKLLQSQVMNNWLQNIHLLEESLMTGLQLCWCIWAGRCSPLSNIEFPLIWLWLFSSTMNIYKGYTEVISP